jgi:hypothetical protein
MTYNGLPLAFANPEPDGIRTAYICIVNLSNALNLALDWITFSKTSHMASADY